VRNLVEEAAKAKISPNPDWLVDQVRAQKYFATSQRVTIFSPRFFNCSQMCTNYRIVCCNQRSLLYFSTQHIIFMSTLT